MFDVKNCERFYKRIIPKTKMKPSLRISQLFEKRLKDGKTFDTTQIMAIIDYLDEEYEKKLKVTPPDTSV